MKILHTIGSVRPESGGPARSSQGIVGGLEAVGVEAWLLSFQPGDTPWFKGVKRFIAAKQGGYQGNHAAVQQAIAQLCPDIVQCNGVWSPYVRATIRTATKAGIPCVVAPRGCFAPWAIKHKWFKKTAAWWIYLYWDLRKAAAFHVTSKEEAKDVRQLGFRQPVFVVPNAVEVPGDDFCCRRSQKGTKNRVRTVLFLGRIHFQKGLRELIEAWAEVQPVNWRLVIAGTDRDGQQKDFEVLSRKLGVSSTVHFTGEIQDADKWKAYAQADVFVLPSYTENFGLSVAEALYAGVPVITTNTTPWGELASERCGWWIDIGANPLVKSLQEAMNLTDEERMRMGANGQRLVESKYTWPAVAEKMKVAYESLVGL